MSETLKFGNGQWAVKDGSALAYNSENGNFKPLPFTFDRSTSATRVNKQGLIEVVSNNEPRIDFSNDSKGALLLEPNRSNLIPYSEDFSNAAWTKSNATVTLSSELSPMGTLNAYNVVYTSGGFIIDSVSTTKTIGSSETISIFSKSDIAGTFLKFGGGTASGTDVEKKEYYGNGWFRYSVTRTFTEAETGNTQLIVSSTDVGLNVVLFGAQLEQGSYATSYIPTQGSIGTRVAESCNGAGNEQVFNDSEGVLFAEISALADDLTYRILSLSNGTTAQRIYIQYLPASNQISVVVKRNSVTQSNMGFILPNETEFSKVAFKYKANDFALWINGIEVNSSSGVNGGLTPISLSELAFDDGNGSNDFYGNTKQIKYFNQALTDAELAALTKI